MTSAALFCKLLLVTAISMDAILGLITTKSTQCVRSAQGKVKSFRNRMGGNGILICSNSSSDGVFRWKNIDGSSTVGEEFDPARDCSDIVERVPETKDGFYWISLTNGKPHKVWCDVQTDGGGFMLVGMKDTPASWKVPTRASTVNPTGPAQWSSVFGNLIVHEFAVQVSINNSFEGTRAHWLYRLEPKRALGNLFGVGKGGCTDVHSGIGNVAYVKDLLTNTVVTTKFNCSKFGPHVNVALGWARMNHCLKNSCPTGYAFFPGISLQLDNFGSFSYSTTSALSGITHDSTAFVGCVNHKCCACYGPKGGRKNYCGKICTAMNGGTVTKQAYVWLWVRTRMPSRVWKRCMEFTMKTDGGKPETFYIDRKTGSAHKGSCANHFHALLNEGTLSVSDKSSLESIPPVPGLLAYRKDNKQLYVNKGNQWVELSNKKEVLSDLNSNKKEVLSDLNNVFKKLKTRIDKLEKRLADCRDWTALGMESKAISDNQITASSEHDRNHGPTNARLNFRAQGGKTGAWSARYNNQYQWLQVDFGRLTKVQGISTQGRQEHFQSVKSYTISFKNNGKYFHSYKPGGILKIFRGNSDQNTIVHHDIKPPIATRFIRIHPRTWHGHISMRVEFYGCYYPV